MYQSAELAVPKSPVSPALRIFGLSFLVMLMASIWPEKDAMAGNTTGASNPEVLVKSITTYNDKVFVELDTSVNLPLNPNPPSAPAPGSPGCTRFGPPYIYGGFIIIPTSITTNAMDVAKLKVATAMSAKANGRRIGFSATSCTGTNGDQWPIIDTIWML